MKWQDCARCGETYYPVAGAWLCPTCDVDDSRAKMMLFDLRDEEGDED